MGWNSPLVVARLVIIEGANGALLMYSGTPAHGNLVASIAGAAGVDDFLNTYVAGFATYGLGSAAELSFYSLDASETAPGTVKASTVNGGTGSAQDVLIVTAGAAGGAGHRPSITLNSSAHDGSTDASVSLADGAGIVLGIGNLLAELTGARLLVPAGFIDPDTGFTTWPAVTVTSGVNDLSTTSTTPTNVATAAIVGGNTYTVEVYATVVNSVAAGGMDLGLTVPALSAARIDQWTVFGASSVTGAAMTVGAAAGTYTAAWTPGAATSGLWRFSGFIEPSASGNLSVAFAAHTAGDSVTLRARAYMRLQRHS